MDIASVEKTQIDAAEIAVGPKKADRTPVSGVL